MLLQPCRHFVLPRNSDSPPSQIYSANTVFGNTCFSYVKFWFNIPSL